ncbi:Crp/Fnr family transcriptional regulator [Streptomyces sp. UNOC14_S4]|uniref:Crp/Fnr family transcriptional regulator n=1 Tax=Streptomyces sp. UNOC14_S4 TaxID=2872340 RepID=UPI001E5E7FFE|nr:Crp/Fnr family transcriptional regulator [Streptomyces sp. UNOC14_S4]MCC3771539.1 Crp/Fnr family transcriptional regulator [Streptomyces sp. UNOC14_S4]
MPSAAENSRLTDLLLGHQAMPDGSFLQRLPTQVWQAMLQTEPRPRARVFAQDELLPLGAEFPIVYIVIEGCVRQDRYPLGDGKGIPTVTRFRGIGELVGEAKLISPDSSVATRCLSQTVVIPWSVRSMNLVQGRAPEVQLALLRSLEDRNRSDELVYTMSARPPFERVARLISHLADIAGVPDPRTSNCTVVIGPSQKDMAAALQLGLSTVENEIRTLRRHRVVDARYRKFVVRDLEALRRFAAHAV